MVNVQIAHICAASPSGPRYDPVMSDQERDGFANLILLCQVHHVTVDKTDPAGYPVEVLREWKAQREADGQAALEGLRGLTEDRLQELITESFEDLGDKVDAALARFEQVDSEAAGLLRTLLDELADPRLQALRLDPDLVSMLNRAAFRLQELPDVVPQLARTAEELRGLPDAANALSAAARSIRSARGDM
jgi:hypothetical protein